MGDSSMIDASKYPGAELADTSDHAYKKAKMVWSSSQVRQIRPTRINILFVIRNCDLRVLPSFRKTVLMAICFAQRSHIYQTVYSM